MSVNRNIIERTYSKLTVSNYNYWGKVAKNTKTRAELIYQSSWHERWRIIAATKSIEFKSSLNKCNKTQKVSDYVGELGFSCFGV